MLKNRIHRANHAKLLRRLVALSAAAAALFPSPVHAEATPASFGFGLFVGIAFEQPTIEWGAEGFTLFRFGTSDGCTLRPSTEIGPVVQLSMLGVTERRLTVGVQGGSKLSESDVTESWLTATLGASYRFGDRAGIGIHTAVSYEYGIANASLRRQWLLNETSLVGGARFSNFGSSIETCIAGRPLRTASGLARIDARAREIDDGSRKSATPRRDLLERAGRAWERDAQYECASIPAFLQLAAELLANGAPDDLVDRALSAAEDEMRHAVICARMASRYLGTRVWPALPATYDEANIEGRATRSPDLAQLAIESWLDGCLSEGAAAARAARASHFAVDTAAKNAQARIASDEARHAELGWSILRWAVAEGGSDVRDAIWTRRDAEMAMSNADANGLSRYGQLPMADIDAIGERHLEESRRRLEKSL
jgi:hypothetical protein